MKHNPPPPSPTHVFEIRWSVDAQAWVVRMWQRRAGRLVYSRRSVGHYASLIAKATRPTWAEAAKVAQQMDDLYREAA